MISAWNSNLELIPDTGLVQLLIEEDFTSAFDDHGQKLEDGTVRYTAVGTRNGGTLSNLDIMLPKNPLGNIDRIYEDGTVYRAALKLASDVGKYILYGHDEKSTRRIRIISWLPLMEAPGKEDGIGT